jgi:L-ascorbate metabolism protein UlaG (beta-lactamase superfamily)
MTADQRVYLKQNVQVDPLINQWYAWSYLVPPATRSMYVAKHHLKIMQSFLSAPQIHVAALKNPSMLGGPFMNYGPSKVREVKTLLDRILKEQADLLALAEAIKSLDSLLEAKADGNSLEALYAEVPAPLRGHVELVYDLNNSPSFRLLESLLYASKYYQEDSQSIGLSTSDSDDRPFVFSTPKLEDEDWLHLHVPFRSIALDELFRMKRQPQPYGMITDLLNIEAPQEERFSSFFTQETPVPPPRFNERSVRIKYFGHACLLIESRGVRILTDPVISYKHSNGIERYSYQDLPESIDYVLLTHNHQDHVMFETLLQIRHLVKTVVIPRSGALGLADPSLKLILKHLGFANVVTLEEMEALPVEGGEIVSVPFLGEHGDLNVLTKTSYLVRLDGHGVHCLADSNNIDPVMYERVRDLVGPVDAMFIGMECKGAPFSWLYGPLLTRPIARKMDEARRLNGSNCSRGIGIVDILKPDRVYVYAMGQEPWLTHVTSIQYTDESYQIVESNNLVDSCRARGLESERLFGQKEIVLG